MERVYADPSRWNGGRLNLRKHRVTFIEAVSVFEDPLARIFDDPAHSSMESREIIIGIISTRRVTKREKNDYEEYIANQI